MPTAAQRALTERRKNRRLPTIEVPQVEQDELARSLRGIQEHLRMYEGDSGAPKERFVTLAELENVGLLKSDVKGKFAYISQVLDKDVSQMAGSTLSATQTAPVKTDTSRSSRKPASGASKATGGSVSNPAAKLNNNSDVDFANPAVNDFLYYDGTKFTTFPLFKRDNHWLVAQRFNKPLRLLEQSAGPAAASGLGYIWVKDDAPSTLWFTDDAGTATQLGTGGSVSEADVESALSAATAFTANNYVFNVDQTVGAGQDNYVLTYDNATGEISLEAATGGGLANVVEDTTPQLGGNLDLNSQTINGTGTINFTGALTASGTITGNLFSGSGASLTSIPETAITDGSVLARVAGTETISGTWNFSATKSTHNTLFMNERASATTDVGGDGQLWVITRTPNDLYFTDDAGNDMPVGYAKYRQNLAATETIGTKHINGVWYKTNTTAYTLTLEASSGTNFPVGAQLTIYNAGSSGNLTIADTATQTLYYMDGSSVTDVAGSCTIAPGGYATLVRESTTISRIMGSGVTA